MQWSLTQTEHERTENVLGQSRVLYKLAQLCRATGKLSNAEKFEATATKLAV